MNNPDHISETLETIFWVKILKFFDADPGSGMEKNRIRDASPHGNNYLLKNFYNILNGWPGGCSGYMVVAAL